MYYDFKVKIPKAKDKIYERTIKGVVYINYEYDRIYGVLQYSGCVEVLGRRKKGQYSYRDHIIGKRSKHIIAAIRKKTSNGEQILCTSSGYLFFSSLLF